MLTLSLFIFFGLDSNSKCAISLQEAAPRFLGFGFWKALKASFVSATGPISALSSLIGAFPSQLAFKFAASLVMNN